MVSSKSWLWWLCYWSASFILIIHSIPNARINISGSIDWDREAGAMWSTERRITWESLKMTFIDIDIVGYCLENCILKFVLGNRRKNMLTMFRILFAPNWNVSKHWTLCTIWANNNALNSFSFQFSLSFGVFIITNAIFMLPLRQCLYSILHLKLKLKYRKV